MPYQKYAAKGVIIKFGTAATPTAVVSGIESVGINLGERGLVETTTHDSTTTRDYEDSKLRDTEEITATIVYDPADAVHEALRAAHATGAAGNSGNPYYLTLVLPDAGAAQWAASGFVTRFEVPNLGAANDPLRASFTFKAKSVSTFTA